jgi:hypothetical protein
MCILSPHCCTSLRLFLSGTKAHKPSNKLKTAALCAALTLNTPELTRRFVSSQDWLGLVEYIYIYIYIYLLCGFVSIAIYKLFLKYKCEIQFPKANCRPVHNTQNIRTIKPDNRVRTVTEHKLCRYLHTAPCPVRDR